MSQSRLIAPTDLKTGGFEDLADEWATNRGVVQGDGDISDIVYPDIATGELNTPIGKFFRIWNGDSPRTYNRYERTDDGSELVSPLITSTILSSSGGAALVGLEGGGTVQEVLKRYRSLSSLGVIDGQDATAEIAELITTAQSGDHIVFDRNVTYTATTGLNLSGVSDVTVEWTESGLVSCTNIDNATNQFFLRIVGPQQGNLYIPSGDIVKGKWFVDVTDASSVQVDDLICIKTNTYFNGLTSVSGWDLCNQQEWMRVRSVIGNNIRFTNGFIFDTSFADIAVVELYRSAKNIRIINPRAIGPGLSGSTVTNGNGARFLMTRGVVDFTMQGGSIKGFPGYIAQITRFENAWVDGVTMDSGELLTQSQAFYGISHEGGRGGRVSNCVGRNIRRVADTGGGAAIASDALLAIDIHHENIRGEMMNGSAAGTHHAFNYTFENVTAITSPTAMTIRSKNNEGRCVRGLNLSGPLIITGPGSEYEEEGPSVGICKISGMYCEGTADGAVRSSSVMLYANGDYDLSGDLLDHDNQGIHIRAAYIDGFKLRGKVLGSPTTLAVNNLVFSRTTPGSTRQKRLKNVDIQGVEFNYAATSDIQFNGTSEALSPAENIVICGNIGRSVLTNQFLFNPNGSPGYIKGETCRIENNIGTNGSTTDPIQIGNPTYWTARPTLQGNRKVYDGVVGFRQFSRGDFSPVCIGRFANATTIPTGTTVLDGDWFEVINPSAGAYPEFQAIFSGTIGTLSGVTATTTAGSAVVILSGNIDLKVGLGCIITISGSGSSVFRVIDISSDLSTVTVDQNVPNAVTGATVGYRNPTWKGKGILES